MLFDNPLGTFGGAETFSTLPHLQAPFTFWSLYASLESRMTMITMMIMTMWMHTVSHAL